MNEYSEARRELRERAAEEGREQKPSGLLLEECENIIDEMSGGIATGDTVMRLRMKIRELARLAQPPQKNWMTIALERSEAFGRWFEGQETLPLMHIDQARDAWRAALEWNDAHGTLLRGQGNVPA